MLALALVATVARSASGDGKAAAFVSVYQDDDHVSVISPQLVASTEIDDRVEVEAGWEADIISAASVDIVTAASPRGFEEVRHGLIAGASFRPEPEVGFGIRYLPSWEPDFDSHAVAARTVHEWLERRVEQRLELRASFDRVGRAGEPTETWRKQTSVSAAASVGVIVDRWTVAQLAYEVASVDGFQASPYRFVPVSWEPTAIVVRVPERTPEHRARHAIGPSVRRALARDWFASAGYRFYADDWGIVSHTGELELQHELVRDRLVLGANARVYWQSSASFHRKRYVTPTGEVPRFRSADKMLSRSWSLLAGARSELGFGRAGPFEVLRATLSLAVYEQRFEEFAPLEARTAVIASLGASGEY